MVVERTVGPWLACGLVALGACSGSGLTPPGDRSPSPAGADASLAPAPDAAARPDAAPEAGEVSSEAGSSATDADPLPGPVPKVRLAPQAESALPCADVELAFDFDAEAAPNEFSVDQAFWMMWFAERAFFAGEDQTRRELASLGFHALRYIRDSETGLELFVAGSERLVVVGFRGSTELNDWLANLNFPQVEGAASGLPGRVHRGFLGSLSPSLARLRDAVAELAGAGQPVWLTGHSLGGAQATLAAAWLHAQGVRLGPLYTFAAPRAGDGTFARALHGALGGRAYNVVNWLDIVPRLPPAAVASEQAANALPLGKRAGAASIRDMDYRHVGRMAWLPHAGGADLTLGPALDDREDVSYWSSVAAGGTLGTLLQNRAQAERHAQGRYLCRLLRLRDAARVPDPRFDRAAAEARAQADSWALRATRTVEAWQRVRAAGRAPGEGVRIALPDTGVSEHPELGPHAAGNPAVLWGLARDFAQRDDDPRHDFSAPHRFPSHGRGSETASLIVSPLGCPLRAADAACVTGAAPAAALLPLRVSPSVVLVGGARAAEAVRYAVDQGAHVLSFSLSNLGPIPAVREALAEAVEAGMIVVVAAGDGERPVEACGVPGVVCVAGVTPSLAPWSGSARGARVDLAAPATQVRFAKTSRGTGHARAYELGQAEGTSVASALTASAAALWLSYHGRGVLLARYGAAALPRVFRALLTTRGVQVPQGWPLDAGYGAGVLDAALLLDAPLPPPQ